MQRTDEKNPRPAEGSGISHNNIHLQEHFAQPASRSPHWWGFQSCTCRGNGTCLCCRRFARAIDRHLVRVGG